MIERKVIDAYINVGDDGVEWWMVITENPDGSKHTYALPSVTFENLAAEYGFDESDIDFLLDIAIHQLHIPEPLQKSNRDNDAAAKMGFVRDGMPVTLGNADSIDHAREAHLERIRWVKNNEIRVVMHDEHASGSARNLSADMNIQSDKLASLKETYQFDPDRLEAKRKAVQSHIERMNRINV